jgi:hypothetical protein
MEVVAPHPDKSQTHRGRNDGGASIHDPPIGLPYDSAGVVDANSGFRAPPKSLRAFAWFWTGIRLSILLLAGVLVVLVARE